MKSSFDGVVRALFGIVGAVELYLGVTGQYPSNLGPLAIGAAILCWLFVRWRAGGPRKAASRSDDPPT
jgi:hypothetical protein